MSIDEAMADLRKTAAAINRPRTLAAENAEKVAAVETEIEYLKRDNRLMWEALLALLPQPAPAAH